MLFSESILVRVAQAETLGPAHRPVQLAERRLGLLLIAHQS